MTEAHVAIVAHCTYDGLSVHHWMHEIPEDAPAMPFNMAVTIMDNSGGQRRARAGMILKADVPANHVQMQDFVKHAVDDVEAVRDILAQPEHSLLLVAFKQHDPLSVLGESDCLSVFVRQYTEHTVLGNA